MLRSDRRDEERSEGADRRSLPRPPLWLNLVLLLFAIAALVHAKTYRRNVATRFSDVIAREARTPAEVNKIKEQLAGMGLTKEALEKELDSRLKFAASLRSNDFYLSVDTEQTKLRFYYGDTILREADVVIGPPQTIKGASGKNWTFAPLKGAFAVQSKAAKHIWQIPEWVYALNGQPIPAERPWVAGGLGTYVISLPNSYVIHSPPSEKSPLEGAKPGSFMVPESDLRAIWPRIEKGTAVYVF